MTNTSEYIQTGNLNSLLWTHVTKSGNKKIYNWLNEDNGEIILDRGVVWIEKYGTGRLPNYVYEYIKNWAISLGYQWLYDLNTN